MVAVYVDGTQVDDYTLTLQNDEITAVKDAAGALQVTVPIGVSNNCDITVSYQGKDYLFHWLVIA